MDQSVKIKNQLISDHREVREQALLTFLEAPEGHDFFAKVAELIAREVMISGIPFSDVASSPLYATLFHLVPKLISLSDSLLDIVRRYDPDSGLNLWDYLFVERIEPLLQSAHIKSCYETHSLAEWARGKKMFWQNRRIIKFYEDVKAAVKDQVEHSRPFDQANSRRELLEYLDRKSLELFENDEGLVDFFRKYDPTFGLTIWDYVLTGRIKKALIGWARDDRERPRPGTWNSLSDLSSQTEPDVEVEDDDGLSFYAEFMTHFSKLTDNYREIFVLDFWGLLSEVHKRSFRELIIERAIANRIELGTTVTESEMYAQITEAISLGELKLASKRSEQNSKQRELEEVATGRAYAARIQSGTKRSLAIRFEKLDGLQSLRSAGESESLLLGSRPIPARWFQQARTALYDICLMASKNKISEDTFKEKYYSYFPLSIIYPNYRPQSGPQKVINETLWVLREFGLLCQSQAFQYRVYLNKTKEIASLSNRIGMADADIAAILSKEVGNVRTMRRRTKVRLIKYNGQDKINPARLNESVSRKRSANTKVKAAPAVKIVCSEFKD